MENLSKIVSIFGIIGIPSIFTIVMWCFSECRKYANQISILMKAQQAQMRNQLLEQYHRYIQQGYISEEEMEDWENQYQAYHSLGKNGVLDSRREKLLSLPNSRKELLYGQNEKQNLQHP